MLINAKSESWKKFILTIDAQNVWKKVYRHGVKKKFMKKIEVTGIKLPTGVSTTSLDEIMNAVLQKSFPSDPEEKDNSFQKDSSCRGISWYLRRGDFLSSDQNGFTPHQKTEDALLRLNEIVKRGKMKHLHSILISLDIKGAFDNAWWPCILNLLRERKFR
ncbi:uncharacterized protein TNCV_4850761 [Trichonephila clavipes]|nr:uncharacterized protein TNCV_4850761 [Trichonephila clavipes]